MRDQDRAWQCIKADVTMETFPSRFAQPPPTHFANVRQQLRLGVFYLYGDSSKQDRDALCYDSTVLKTAE